MRLWPRNLVPGFFPRNSIRTSTARNARILPQTALPTSTRYFALSHKAMSSATPWQPGRYPASRRSDRIDTYKSKAEGEVKVADPYQWLEENSKETEQWVDGAFCNVHRDRRVTWY